MIDMTAKFHSLLRDTGRSVTRSRTLLFEYLQASGAVSPKQFMDDNAKIADRASLYRSLLLFRELGVVEERLTGGKKLIELTDSYDVHHHHFTCTHCGRTVAITMPKIEAALVTLCEREGFEVQGHMIEVSGLCDQCAKNIKP